jgi:photosystem II stability/assembly factor-like uncharacterized protein
MHLPEVDARLAGHEGDWTFVGDPSWTEDRLGVMYPPVWSNPRFDADPALVPDHYAHPLAREDYAFLSAHPLSDTDVSVDFWCPYGSVVHGGIVFRAVDSARCCVLDLADLGRKGQAYELSLWAQDGSGFRRELAKGTAPHSIVSERIVQRGARTREDWVASSPDWVTVRVQASGTFHRVSMDGAIVFEVRDGSCPVGCVGLVARGAVKFRNLKVRGVPADRQPPWSRHEGELPRFFLPGGEQPEGFNAYPAVCRTADGAVCVAWSHAPKGCGPGKAIVLSISRDEARTWSRPRPIYAPAGRDCHPSSLFAHADGGLSCLLGAASAEAGPTSWSTQVIVSRDGGRTWSTAEEFRAGGRPLPAGTHLYSPALRLADGTVVMCGYETRTVPGGSSESNAERLDRSLLFRSRDDGRTWEAPTLLDAGNDDHNECMVAEVAPNRLVAFMRTLRATYLWTSTSEDGGGTWEPLAQTTVSAECPMLLRHSSGVLLLGSRGCGTFLNLSRDQGRTWSRRFRVSPASAMMGMVEMGDGSILIVMHEGYRIPGLVRAQLFRLTPAGPAPAEAAT